MVRTLSTTQYTTRLATEPLVIIAIDWDSGMTYYGDKSFTLDGYTVKGDVLSFSSVDATGTQEATGEVSSASVLLDDGDGTLKSIVNQEAIEGKVASVYHHYVGDDWADNTLILKGKIAGTVVWSEGARTLGFDIESYIDDAEVGYASYEGDLTDQNPDTYGVAWPLCFGTVLKVPALPIFKKPLGNNVAEVWGGKPSLDAVPFEVEGGTTFPQLEDITIVVGQTKFFGQMDGRTFNRTQSNLTWYTNVPILPRVAGDVYETNKRYCWVSASYNLVGKYCWVSGIGFAYCLNQQGSRCYFNKAFSVALDDTHTFNEVRGSEHASWYTDPLSWLNYWYVREQTVTYQFDGAENNKYIANLYPSDEILEVYGTRRIDGEIVIAPIPSSYYTASLSDTISGKNTTTITFDDPIESREGEDWSGDVFVSLRSTLASNVSDVIKWLVETYTSFGTTVSFDTVRAQTNAYPVYFTIFDQPNVLALIEDIAYQARCALFIRNAEVSIKYLSEEPTPDYTITDEDVLLKTLLLSFTDTEEIYTRLEGKWQDNYYDDPKTMIYKNNIDTYGVRSQDREFFIYNIEELVKMSVYFWGYRKSYSWRMLEIDTVMRTLQLEVYDSIRNNLSIVSANSIKGVVEADSLDTENHTIALKAELASRAGDVFGGEPIEDSGYWYGDPAYPVQARDITDPGDGRSQIDYTVPTNPETSNPNSQPALDDTDYYYAITAPTFSSIGRSTDFTITVELQDAGGNKVNTSVDAKLSLHSDDSSDRLDSVVEQTISLVNGTWTDDQQITGGSGEDLGFLSVVDSLNRSNFNPTSTSAFTIHAAAGAGLVWTTSPPATVVRGEGFTVEITGGVEDDVIDVAFNNVDASDQLINILGVEITEITLGAGGTYTGQWGINGGDGTDAANDIDISSSLYTAVTSSAFSVTEVTPDYVTDEIVMSHVVELDGDVLELTFRSGNFLDTYQLDAIYKDAFGATRTDYTGTITLTAKDSGNNTILFSLPTSGSTIYLTMTAGIAYGAGVTFENTLTGKTSPATLTATTDGHSDTLDLTWIPNQSIVQTLTPLQANTISGVIQTSIVQTLTPEDGSSTPTETAYELIGDFTPSHVLTHESIAGADHFEVTTTTDSPIEGANGYTFGITVTAKDGGGATVTDYNGDVTLNPVYKDTHADNSFYTPSHSTITLSAGSGTIAAFGVTLISGDQSSDNSNFAMQAIDDGGAVGYKDFTELGWSYYFISHYEGAGSATGFDSLESDTSGGFLTVRDTAYAENLADTYTVDDTDRTQVTAFRIGYNQDDQYGPENVTANYYCVSGRVDIPEMYRETDVKIETNITEYSNGNFVSGEPHWGYKCSLASGSSGSDLNPDGTFDTRTLVNGTDDWFEVEGVITVGVGTQSIYFYGGTTYKGSYPGVDTYADASGYFKATRLLR